MEEGAHLAPGASPLTPPWVLLPRRSRGAQACQPSGARQESTAAVAVGRRLLPDVLQGPPLGGRAWPELPRPGAAGEAARDPPPKPMRSPIAFALPTQRCAWLRRRHCACHGCLASRNVAPAAGVCFFHRGVQHRLHCCLPLSLNGSSPGECAPAAADLVKAPLAPAAIVIVLA